MSSVWSQASLTWTGGGVRRWDWTPDTQPLLSLPPSVAGHPGAPWGGPGAAVSLCWGECVYLALSVCSVVEMVAATGNVGEWT